MKRHVDLLALFHLVWGALSLAAGAATLALALGALAIVASAERTDLGPNVGATFTAGVFFAFAVAAVAWGGLHLWVGRALGRRLAWARVLGLGIAVLNLFFLPLGTALAVYTLWVLLTNETRRMFEPDAPLSTPGAPQGGAGLPG
ncbi:MAG TPA: hypothetical protein PLE61_06045 [Vicinamibacterales bacterium]|nr:hypothetical protein [Vicinamibacterales bacterium]HPW20359.1 hypothetical protein [Vicinamibacterales bacterium]